MKIFIVLALSILAACGSSRLSAQTNKLASVGLVSGVVTVTDRIGTPTNQAGTVGNNLAGLTFAAGNIPGAVDTSIVFFTLTGVAIPGGSSNPADSFTNYGTLISPTAVGSYPDVRTLLTANSYAGLTFAIDNLSLPSAGSFYTIHHRPLADYFAVITPATGGGSAVSDLKPMSWQAVGGAAGGPASTGTTGYFALAYTPIIGGGAVTGYSAGSMFYLRTDTLSHIQFGEMIPALTSASTDKIDLTTAVGSFGATGYTTLAYSPANLGYGANQFYYLRQDTITGNTILGRLDPSLVPGTRTISDIANLGGSFNTLAFAAPATGASGAWGNNQLYATGTRTATAQSISFPAIADRAISAGAFTVSPSASSGLAIALTVAPTSTGAASIAGPVAGVFTVTPTAAGVITLQATQSGGAFDSNMLRQSFNATGITTLVITTQPTPQTAAAGTTATFTVAASGSSTVSYQWRKGGFNIPIANASATTATLSLPNVQAVDVANYDVVVTNLSGSIPSNSVGLTVTSGSPVISSPSTAAGTVNTAFSTYSIVATNSPTSFGVTGLPPGLTLTGSTINGTPTTAGVYPATISATNGAGTGSATLTITIAQPGVAPTITSPTIAAGTAGAVFATYNIVATNSPTSYSASGLPPGLTLTGSAINGTPATPGKYVATISATNTAGTGGATLTITVSSAGAAPIITNNPLTAAGTLGIPFSYTVVATGSSVTYLASNLPSGLTLNSASGLISGTPSNAGTTVVSLVARNDSGAGTATLTITVGAVTVAPVLTSPPNTVGTVGAPLVTYFVTATGLPTSYTAANLPPGLAINSLTGAINGTPTASGTTFTAITATNSAGTSTATLMFVIASAAGAPIITSPVTAAGTAGQPFVTYLIVATGLPTIYTATGLPAGLTVNSLTGAINGTPTAFGVFVVTLSATNASGTTTATVTIVIAPPATVPSSQIVNFSARAISGPGSQSLIMGFVVTGNGKSLLVRGIGPALSVYGVQNALADPLLTLFLPGGATATNDDWQTPLAGQADGATIASMGARVGAFSLANGSKDSALLLTVNHGAHTTGMLRPNSTTGVALTEIYDVERLTSSRLTNVSARMNVTAGEGTLIAGLVIVGNAPKSLLIRGVGPTLSSFGVAGALADPTIAVFSGTTQIASNDNWETGASTGAQITAASLPVGAFTLQAGSKDAALVVTLQPGTYTVQVTGVGNTTGVALIEIYDLP